MEDPRFATLLDGVMEALRCTEDEQASCGERLQGSLRSLLGHPLESFGTLSPETLGTLVKPIHDALEALDAEQLLRVDRVDAGAALYSGVVVRPIHDRILPPILSSAIRYLHIAEVEDQYSAGIFVFPPGARIPLHNHPGMCVLSRVLYGDLTRQSFDLIRNDESSIQEPLSKGSSWIPWSRAWKSSTQYPSGYKRARRKPVDVLVAPACTMLCPIEGNLHEFVAGKYGAAVLDVLLPPYDEHTDRDCTFFVVESSDDKSEETEEVILLPSGQPDDFRCVSGSYEQLGSGA